MNLVKTVRAGCRAAISTMRGSTRSIHGVSQMCPGAKIFCMSVQRWTASVIGSTCVVKAITLGLPAGQHLRFAPQLEGAGAGERPDKAGVHIQPQNARRLRCTCAHNKLALA